MREEGKGKSEQWVAKVLVAASLSAWLLLPVPCSLFPASAIAATSEITVDLRFCVECPLSGKSIPVSTFVSGERIRCVANIANPSPDKVSVGYANSQDSFFIEVFQASDMHQLSRTAKRPFVSRFVVLSNQGQKLEAFLGDHYSLREASRYLAKPVLVHRGVRYEGALRAFDVVNGIQVGSALQIFKNRAGLQREFSLVYWNRDHSEHLFLTAKDTGTSTRRWETRDLGPMLRLERPSLCVLPRGEVIVLHRYNTDQFLRTELWSLPDDLTFRSRETMRDPETAGTQRVRELYKNGGVKPKTNPWWKFW